MLRCWRSASRRSVDLRERDSCPKAGCPRSASGRYRHAVNAQLREKEPDLIGIGRRRLSVGNRDGARLDRRSGGFRADVRLSRLHVPGRSCCGCCAETLAKASITQAKRSSSAANVRHGFSGGRERVSLVSGVSRQRRIFWCNRRRIAKRQWKYCWSSWCACKTRTCDLLVRSQTLYPTELRARGGAKFEFIQRFAR